MVGKDYEEERQDIRHAMPVGTAVQRGNRKAKKHLTGEHLAGMYHIKAVSLERQEQEGEWWEL